jgi:hypothetical protein
MVKSRGAMEPQELLRNAKATCLQKRPSYRRRSSCCQESINQQGNSMKSVIRILCAIAAVVVMSGCATSFDKKATTVDWTKGSVVVMSVEVDNQYKPGYQPTGLGVMLKKKAGAEPREYIPAFSRERVSGSKVFLVTQQIQPGKYTVSKLYGFSQQILIMGGIDFAVDAPFDVAPNSVIYLGRISGIRPSAATVQAR